jgi:hypothetical protein
VKTVRDAHHTRHSLGVGHFVLVRRAGGRDLWLVEEHHAGQVRDVVRGAIWTTRDEADAVAELTVETYAAIRGLGASRRARRPADDSD